MSTWLIAIGQNPVVNTDMLRSTGNLVCKYEPSDLNSYITRENAPDLYIRLRQKISELIIRAFR